MDPITDQWDPELLYSIFEPEDVKEILKIPVRGGMEDLVAWNHDYKGIFSINSTYKMLKQTMMLVHLQLCL
jgi:hypothetical protein